MGCVFFSGGKRASERAHVILSADFFACMTFIRHSSHSVFNFHWILILLTSFMLQRTCSILMDPKSLFRNKVCFFKEKFIIEMSIQGVAGIHRCLQDWAYREGYKKKNRQLAKIFTYKLVPTSLGKHQMV